MGKSRKHENFYSLRSNISVLFSSLQTPELPSLFSRSAGPALSGTASTAEAPLPCFARFAVFPPLQPKTKQKKKTGNYNQAIDILVWILKDWQGFLCEFFLWLSWGCDFQSISFPCSQFEDRKLRHIYPHIREKKKGTVFLPFEVKNNLSLVGNFSTWREAWKNIQTCTGF